MKLLTAEHRTAISEGQRQSWASGRAARPSIWDEPNMDETLRRMTAEGASQYAISVVLGVAQMTVWRRMRILGLKKTPHVSRIVDGAAAAKDRIRGAAAEGHDKRRSPLSPSTPAASARPSVGEPQPRRSGASP